MQYLYFVSGQAGSSVHETLCLLRDIYRLQASPSIYHSADGNDGAEPSIWRINPAALASIRCFPPRGLGPYKMVYLYKPAYERENSCGRPAFPSPLPCATSYAIFMRFAVGRGRPT